MLSVDSHAFNPIVRIPGIGTVRGELDKSVPVVRFLGIPYATVNTRWNPAIPVEAWDGIRDATKARPSPPQPTVLPPLMALMGGVDERRTYEDCFSEKDCLNLSIYKPDDSVLTSGESLPVMVWIHGGAFRTGGNDTPLHDCTNFVAASIERKKPVIVVCINYRLNYFGFLASKELKDDIDSNPSLTGEQKAVGNWGLQDQKLALLWVRSHVSAFSGDKDDITAFGQSAGAISIAYHMMMPPHHGLFHKAILHSGALLTMPAQDIEHQCQAHFDNLCEHFGVSKGMSARDKVERLRAVPESEIAEFLNVNHGATFCPTVDGVLIDRPVHSWFEDLARLDPGVKKVMVGVNHDEGTLFGAFGVPTGNQWRKVRTRLGTPSELVIFDQLYGEPGDDAEALARTNMHVLNDLVFQAPILSFASLMIQAPHVDTSVCLFNCLVSSLEKKYPGIGAAHSWEMVYLFDSPPCRSLLSEDEDVLAKELRQVWLEFVTTASKDIVPVVARPVWDDGTTEKSIVVFQRDLKVGRSNVVDWISKKSFEYWIRFFRFQNERIAEGDYGTHGYKIDATSD